MSESHDHEHPSHPHHHHHERTQDARKLGFTLVLVVLYMLVELIGGLWTNSLALLADAGHMLSDAGALGLSLFAIWVARKPTSGRRTYGFHRAEILAALANGAALLAIAGIIAVEAWQRIWAPEPVQGGGMMAIALGGLLINLGSLLLLDGHGSENLNVRGAWLHVLTDTLGSLGAVMAGACILLLGWTWVDPVASVLIAALVLYSGWHLLEETVDVLMEAAPQSISLEEIRGAIREQSGVSAVHDLHVWTITSGMVAMSGHLEIEQDVAPAALLSSTTHLLRERFHIHHVTLQIEPPSLQPCSQGIHCAPPAPIG